MVENHKQREKINGESDRKVLFLLTRAKNKHDFMNNLLGTLLSKKGRKSSNYFITVLEINCFLYLYVYLTFLQHSLVLSFDNENKQSFKESRRALKR